MRYIGNKTKLLGFIRDVLRRRGIAGGTAVDPFTGTASVARELKKLGFRVVASDLMEYSYVFARAYVEVGGLPDLSRLPEEVRPETGATGDPGQRRRPGGASAAAELAHSLDSVVAYLNRLAPDPGFVHRHFSPEGAEARRHGRMYFTPANAARIDAVRTTLERWRNDDAMDDDGFHLLLAALIEAADRVANTTGVYASFVKSWQPNALKPVRLQAPSILPGNGCRALREDAVELVAGLEPFELLYLDPPYNARQYPGYYHIPELIAGGWFDGPVELRGKTGLMPDQDKRSDWSRRARCEAALEELVARAPCRHIVMSYNTEGIIPERAIERILKAHGRAGSYRRYARRYRRYRSDADGDGRRYRGDEVREYLYCVER